MHELMIKVKESHKWNIVILHSSITYEEQSRIFKNPHKGFLCVILLIHIAESIVLQSMILSKSWTRYGL